MRKYSITVLLLLTAAVWISSGAAAQAIEIITTIEHRFGESVSFQAEIEAEIPVASAVIYFQVERDTRMNMGLAKIKKLDQNRYQAVYKHKISDYAIPAFSTILAHWELFLVDGQVIKSPISSYPYSDNRFKWSVFEQNGIHIYWYRGGNQVGEVVNAAVSQGISAIQAILPGAAIEELVIYIYPDDAAMPSAMGANSVNSILGTAALESGVVMLALPEKADQESMAQQRIPHELMHILLYQYAKDSYAHLPVWLIEGLASAVKSYSNPGYSAALKKASDNNRLLPFRSLCSSFPLDADEALLSYAQSQSFIKFMQNTYGTTGMVSLIGAYSQGLGCEEVFRKSVGISLSQAEVDWKRGLFQNEAQKSLEICSPGQRFYWLCWQHQSLQFFKRFSCAEKHGRISRLSIG